MIKTSVTPQNNNIYLAIPNKYIGKEIEVILYAKDELFEEKTTKSKKTMADFNGIFPENEYQNLNISTKEARKQWNRDI